MLPKLLVPILGVKAFEGSADRHRSLLDLAPLFLWANGLDKIASKRNQHLGERLKQELYLRACHEGVIVVVLAQILDKAWRTPRKRWAIL